MTTRDDDDDSADARQARLERALHEALYVRTLIGPHVTEAVLADEIEAMRRRIAAVERLEFEVRRLNNVQARVHVMIGQWRAVAAEQREGARQWRAQAVESLSWHAIRMDAAAELLETCALLLEATLTTR